MESRITESGCEGKMPDGRIMEFATEQEYIEAYNEAYDASLWQTIRENRLL